MWINKRTFALFEEWKGAAAAASHKQTAALIENAGLQGQIKQLEVHVARLNSTLDWFKHRLTQVEQERAALIYAATGGKDPVPTEVKVSSPSFVGVPSMSEMLNHQHHPFGTMGEDSSDPSDQLPEQVQNMPGFTG